MSWYAYKLDIGTLNFYAKERKECPKCKGKVFVEKCSMCDFNFDNKKVITLGDNIMHPETKRTN